MYRRMRGTMDYLGNGSSSSIIRLKGAKHVGLAIWLGLSLKFSTSCLDVVSASLGMINYSAASYISVIQFNSAHFSLHSACCFR